MNWFSSKVRIVCLIETVGASRYMAPIHLFRAEDYDAARARALVLGRAHEQEYRNGDGHLVRWRFKEIISLDMIRADDLDGTEIYSEFSAIEDGVFIPFDAQFRPEDSDPTNTI